MYYNEYRASVVNNERFEVILEVQATKKLNCITVIEIDILVELFFYINNQT